MTFTREYLERKLGIAVSDNQARKAFAVYKFGHNAAVGASLETIWGEGGLYVYRTSATVMTVSSASTDDVLTSGTGAWEVTIFGLGWDYLPREELVALNGQTAVNTQHAYLRVFRMVVRSAGTGGKNAGILYIGTGAVGTGKPAVVHGLVGAGDNQTLMAMYTIPYGWTGYFLNHGQSSSVAKAITACLAVRPVDEVFQVKDIIEYVADVVDVPFDPPLVFAGSSDLELRALATGGGGDIAASFTLILLPSVP